MRWCEEHDVGYVLGLARNRRLVRALGAQMHEAHSAHRRTGNLTATNAMSIGVAVHATADPDEHGDTE